MPLYEYIQKLSGSASVSFAIPGVPCTFTLRVASEDSARRYLSLNYRADCSDRRICVDWGTVTFGSKASSLGTFHLSEADFPPVSSGSFCSNALVQKYRQPRRRGSSSTTDTDDGGTEYYVKVDLHQPDDQLSRAPRIECIKWLKVREAEDASRLAHAIDRQGWEKERDVFVERQKGLAEYLAMVTSSSSPFDVCLDFPRLGRQLWAVESTLLSSPYLANVLASDFQEGMSSTSEPLSSAKEDVDPYTFDESDDEADAFFLDKGAANIPQPTAPYKRIMVKDTAYTTYRAVLLWMQTDHIEFAPLHSSFRKDGETVAVAQAARLEALQQPSSSTSSSSSIYRLADLLSLDTLKSVALANYISQLTPQNAAHELYSDIAGCYAPVRDAILEYVVERWSEVKGAKATMEMQDKADACELSAEALGTAMRLAGRLAEK
ncbi:hypothetical protein JCM10450v2_001144 [Rhodotorula kratochvilovae]